MNLLIDILVAAAVIVFVAAVWATLRKKEPPPELFEPQADDVKMSQAARAANIDPAPCDCLAAQYEDRKFPDLHLHAEVQDTRCDAWTQLENLIEDAVANGSTEFAPGLEMSPEAWSQIITLPPSIARLTSVKRLYLYRSHLVRIPLEIGAMTNLEELDLYVSYRLHWLPYEVTRCPRLKRSRVSTRALYGNYKYRPPFPRLPADASNGPSLTCSICQQSIVAHSLLQRWISLRVGADVWPLLVNACSDTCLARLPPPARGYVDHLHTGGLELKQPPESHLPPDRMPRAALGN